MRQVLRACLTAFVGVLAGTGCLCGGCGCPKHDYKDYVDYLRAETDHRKKMAQPVVEALESHKQTTGRYPSRLEDLVVVGLLPAIPDLSTNTDHHGRTRNLKNAQPLQYTVVDDVYELRFSYGHIPTALTGADSTHFLYVSQDKKWYSNSGSPARRGWIASPKKDPPETKDPAGPKQP